jgi:uncharacterized membrane protein (UPF0182 family)
VVAARRPPRRWTLAVLLLAFVLLAAIGSITRFYTDLLWFREVGKTQVFWGQISAKLTLGLLAGLGTAIVVGANLWLVERLSPRYGLSVVGRPQVDRYRAVLGPYLRPLRIGVAAFLGLVTGLQSAGLWQSFLLWRNAVPFHESDAQFGRDISFYVFELPFQRAVFGWLFSTLVLATLLSAAGHYLLGGIRPQATSDRVAPQVQAHLSILVGLIVALKAWGYWLDQFQLVYSTRGVVAGASYTDVHAQLPALRLLFFVAIICAGLFFWGARTRGLAFPVAGIVLLGLTSILVGGVYPGIVQRFSVEPQELRRERPYIARNIEATRKAFGLEAVQGKTFPATTDLTAGDLDKNEDTVSNIRLWDPDVLKPAIRNLQAIAPYYSFSDVDVDRYQLGNDQRQVMISTREVDSNLLAPQAKTWQNLHLGYTHGFGVVATRVNDAVNQGQPDFIVSNFDIADAPIPVKQPRVYFSEPPANSPPYVVVGTKQAEIDRPSSGGGETPATISYQGQGGVRLSSMLRRLAFALRFREFNLLISGNITPQSRLIFNRDVRDRVERVAPFLQWDGDPYVVVVDGRIKFVRDGYTTTDRYPYSQRIQLDQAARRDTDSGTGVSGPGNYIRNSVKAVVDAFDGTVTLYGFDDSDPILRAWRGAFPQLFAPKDQIPPSLAAHFRFPEDMFSIQTDRFASYHVTDPDDFYSREDFWALPDDRSGEIRQGGASLIPGEATKMRPYYLLTRLPGETKLGFHLVMPFTPNGKENMISYMAAGSDPDTYGRVTLFTLDRSKTVFGPTQVNARILANREISSLVSLLNREGSRVILGNLLIVPIKDSLLYVQPLFVQGSAENSIPLLTNVAVFYNNQVGFADDLSGALGEVISGAGGQQQQPGQGTTQPPAGGDVQRLLRQADQEFKAAQAALKAGDLAAYQSHVNRAGQLVQQALAAGAKAPAAASATTTTAAPGG